MFLICSCMTTPSPDAAAFVPPPLPPRPFGLRRIRQWLGQLSDISARVMGGVTVLSMYRRRNPTPDGRVEVDLAHRLVVRAMRWVEALRARLAAEAQAARGMRERRYRDYVPPEEPIIRRRRLMAWTPTYAVQPDHGIGDRSAAEVVAQICADLSTAAKITHSPMAAAQIAEIAAAAKALLGGPEEAWTPLPVTPPLAPEPGEAAVAVLPTAVSPISPPAPSPSPSPAPDSG
jgi:hypothetical protein